MPEVDIVAISGGYGGRGDGVHFRIDGNFLGFGCEVVSKNTLAGGSIRISAAYNHTAEESNSQSEWDQEFYYVPPGNSIRYHPETTIPFRQVI